MKSYRFDFVAGVDHVIDQMRASQDDTALIGPVVRDEGGMYYFALILGCSKTDRAGVDQLKAHRKRDALLFQAAVALAIVRELRPFVVHKFDDELALVSFAEALWPDRFATVRAEIEAERATHANGRVN